MSALELPEDRSDDLEEVCGSTWLGSGSCVLRGDASRAKRAKYEQGSQLASSSGQLAEISRGSTVLDRYGRRENVQHLSSLQVDWAKHKVFISHSGAQKDFAEQLCVDLERQGYLRPFFDLRQHSLPKGKDFVPLIKKAAQNCQEGGPKLSCCCHGIGGGVLIFEVAHDRACRVSRCTTSGEPTVEHVATFLQAVGEGFG